jgi:hypothetical protein
MLLMVAACCDHASCWSIIGPLDSFPNEIELSCDNHVFNVQNVIEDASDLGVPYLLFLHVCYVDGDGKNTSDALIQEDFKFVEQALPKHPRFAAP